MLNQLNSKIKYLAILGNGDRICASRHLGNFTQDDSEFPNITKVLVEGEGHISIHSFSERSYSIHILKEFLEHLNQN